MMFTTKSRFEKLDAFSKPRHDLRTRSVVGGLITIIATSSAIILFLSETYLYIQGRTRHSLHLSESISIPLLPLKSERDDKGGTALFGGSREMYEHMIPVYLHVTFPHVTCNQLDFTLNDASYRSGTLENMHYGENPQITLRAPSKEEMSLALDDGGSKQQRVVSTLTGCTVTGTFSIQKVGGEFAVAITRRKWMESKSSILLQEVMVSDSLHRQQLNTSHYIHSIHFGQQYAPKAVASPLQDRRFNVENKFGGIALQTLQVTLIPTVYNTNANTNNQQYQLSIVEHTVQPETLIDKGIPLMPGISISYDFSPIAVHQIEMRDNIIVFLSTLISIVGGVFVTVSLLAGCFVHSAKAVAKKLD